MLINVDLKSVTLGKKEILSDISFIPHENSFTAILGKNGSGKSTLISTIAGLISYEGSISLLGRELSDIKKRELSRLVSFIPQNTPRPHIRVKELVSYGRAPYKSLKEKDACDSLDPVAKALEDAELREISESFLDSVSGGEQRRAYFAMMLAQNTDIALLDEATAFMDADYENKFLAMAKSLASEKIVIAVTHNLDAAVRFADHVLLLDNGEQAFFGSTEELLSNNLIESAFSLKRYVSGGRIFFSAE